MTAYLDASVLVSMFVADANTPSAWRFADAGADCTTSLWAIAEVSSALAFQVRIGRLEARERIISEDRFDRWLAARPEPLAPVADDYLSARVMLRTCKTPLRTPDALHLAVCQGAELEVASFDRRMLLAAEELGIRAAAL